MRVKTLSLLLVGGLVALVSLFVAISPAKQTALSSVSSESLDTFSLEPDIAVRALASANLAVPLLARASDSAEVLAIQNPAPATLAPSYQLDPFSQRVLQLTNAQRTKRGLPPLRLNANLANASGWFARDMATHRVQVLTHRDSLGRDPGTRLRAFGFPWTAYGENIARGYPSPASVVAAWMASPGHRANILNGRFTVIGVGHAFDGGQDYWVQDFGRR